MLQNADEIKLDPRVQVVINMDGWGQPWLKFDTYAKCEASRAGCSSRGSSSSSTTTPERATRVLSPREVLALRPRPIYIQYQ